MRYRKLDSNDDFTFGHGGTDYYQDIPEAPGQAALTRCRAFTYEWFLDILDGTPYNPQILGKYTRVTWERALKKRIRDTPGVLSLDLFETEIDEEKRIAKFNALLTTIYGQTTLNNVEISLLPMYGR